MKARDYTEADRGAGIAATPAVVVLSAMRRQLCLALTFLSLGCGGSSAPVVTPATSFRLPDSTRILTGAGQPLSVAALLRQVGEAKIVLLGEVHDNAVQHQLRADLLTALAARHPAVVFEQFAQSEEAIPAPAPGEALEPWLDAHGFDRKGWQWPLHRPVVEAALAHGRGVWGSGLSRESLRAVVREGEGAAPPELRSILRDTPLDSAARAGIDQELIEGHCGKLPVSMIPGMRAAQVTRDASMTRALLRAQLDGPAWLIAGNGHVRRDMGVPRLLASAAPGVPILVVGLLEREADGASPSARDLSVYDLVIVTPRAEREDPCAGL